MGVSSGQTLNIIKQLNLQGNMVKARENLFNNEHKLRVLYGMAVGSFIENLDSFKLVRKYSLEHIWQGNMMRLVLSQGQTSVDELLDSNTRPYPPHSGNPDQVAHNQQRGRGMVDIEGARMWASPEINYGPNHPMRNISHLLHSATMSQKVDFLYHSKVMREIANFDYDNKVLIRK